MVKWNEFIEAFWMESESSQKNESGRNPELGNKYFFCI